MGILVRYRLLLWPTIVNKNEQSLFFFLFSFDKFGNLCVGGFYFDAVVIIFVKIVFFFHFDLWLSTLTHSVTHRRIRFSVLLYSHPKPMATNARKKSTRNERKNNGIEQRVRVKMKKKKKNGRTF